jgi:HSP20 family molecular chaperone IbpA
MFKKKICANCKEKMKESYSFCPECGHKDGEKKEADYGMLGTNDLSQETPMQIKLPMGLNMIFNSLMKNLNAEMQNMNQDMTKELNKQKMPKMNGISISISSGKNTPPQIKMQNPKEAKTPKILHKSKSFSEKSKKNFIKTEKEEPKTNIRRLGDKVIYELELPGIKSLDEVSFVKLENSIEIKAATKKNAYEKIIQIGMPISHYSLEDEKLILELEAK